MTKVLGHWQTFGSAFGGATSRFEHVVSNANWAEPHQYIAIRAAVDGAPSGGLRIAMKKALPLALVVATFGATVTASPLLPLRLPDAAATQADDPEAPANEAYKAWKAETDPAKKFDSGKSIVSQFFGSKAAEAVAYDGLFAKDKSADQQLAMSYTYITGSNANGNGGQYLEYAFGIAGSTEKDPKKLLENANLYLQKYPTGRYAPHITKNVLPPTRYAVFSALLKELKYNDAIQIANEAFASNENEFLYSYVLTDTAIRDLLSNGAKSQFVGKAEGWAERAAKFIESGQTPAGADPKKWEADKPTSLSLLYKAQGLSKYFATAQSSPKSTDAYDPSIALMKKALESNEKDPVTHFFLGQICDAQNVILSAQFDALPDDQKTADAGNALTAKVNESLDCVISHYLRVTAYAGKNQALADTVKPRLVDLWKYRHADAPDAWMDEVKKIVP